MANRYWVGGTASWDGTAGTKWALTSGGTGGETIPTSADDVFFDAASGVSTVTIATGNTGARSINCTGFTGTITGTGAISVAGSITLVTSQSYTHTGTVTFTGTGTLTTAGKAFSAIAVNGTGITVTLGDALNTSTRTITVTAGTFNSGNFAITAASLSSTGTGAKVISLGNSTVTLSSTGGAIAFVSTGFTFNAGTSTINCSGSTASVTGAGVTFNNLAFTSTTLGTRTIADANTYNNLTLGSTAGAGVNQLAITGTQTITGTFSCGGGGPTQRNWVRSNTFATAVTIQAATLVATDCDFRDITLTGTAAGTSPTRAGDCGGNTGITFPAAKTVYRVGTNTSWQGAASWAPGSGGTGDDLNFPLAQDTAVFDNLTALGTTLTIGVAYNMSSIDCSTRTTALTISLSASTTIYGSFILGSGITISGTSGFTFSGRGTMDIQCAGRTISFPITVDTPTGTFRQLDAFLSSNGLALIRGTYDANDFNVTAVTFSSSGSLARTLWMGLGTTWSLTGTGTVWSIPTITGLTFNPETANILLSNNTTTARTFSGGSLAFNKLTIGGDTSTSTTTISAGSSFTELASTKTVAHTITLSGNLGTIGAWTVTGTAVATVTLNSSTAATRRTFVLTAPTTGINYLSVRDIGEITGSKFAVGSLSTNVSNNQNVYFADEPPLGNMMLMFH